MGVFDSEKGNFVYAPKEGGESVSFTITGELERVKNNDLTNKLNYKKLDNGNQVNFGYYDVLHVDGDRELLINTWKLYFALKDLNPEEGDVITVTHPGRGIYEITK